LTSVVVLIFIADWAAFHFSITAQIALPRDHAPELIIFHSIAPRDDTVAIRVFFGKNFISVFIVGVMDAHINSAVAFFVDPLVNHVPHLVELILGA